MFETEFRQLCQSSKCFQEDGKSLGNDLETRGKDTVFTVYRRIVKLELILNRSAIGMVKNTLYCRVYPNKNLEVYYLLPELFAVLNIEEFESCFFSNIESGARLECCFRQLTALTERYLDVFEHAAADGMLPLEKGDAPTDILEYKMVFSPSPTMRDRVTILHYTQAPAHKALLLGRKRKAIRALEKLRRKETGLFLYEERLYEYLKRCNKDFSSMPDRCNAVRDAELLKQKALPIYAAAFAVLLAAFSVLFLLVSELFLAIFTRDCTARFDAGWGSAILLAGLPALFGLFALRKKLIPLLSRKYGAVINRFDRSANGRGVDTLANLAFLAAVLVTLYAAVQIYGNTVRIYPDRFDAAGESSVLTREEYLFGEIRQICHVRARYNPYGDRIERSSYLIVMKDGRRFDFDCDASESECETVLFPLLEPYGIPLTELDSERELDQAGQGIE
ncbi:MAG: hypothetical protein IKQ54_10715 [Oscillospiraceae bacterium]|nr:hypothetical protein [Oscillospiraceae bacterium]